jgi:hypothetical protein
MIKTETWIKTVEAYFNNLHATFKAQMDIELTVYDPVTGLGVRERPSENTFTIQSGEKITVLNNITGMVSVLHGKESKIGFLPSGRHPGAILELIPA